MMPQKVATSRPRFRLNSRMAARFCSSDNSRSLEIPAAPANAMPARQNATPHQDHLTGMGAEHHAGELAAENGRQQSAEGRRVSEGHRHTEREAQVAHGEAEREAARSP